MDIVVLVILAIFAAVMLKILSGDNYQGIRPASASPKKSVFGSSFQPIGMRSAQLSFTIHSGPVPQR
jgi:hypothetical protein